MGHDPDFIESVSQYLFARYAFRNSRLTDKSYSERYHQYFPIANPAAMEFQNLRTSAAKEPHLLAAILTVASRDEKVRI